jgi:hypothetical protein
MIKYIKEEDGVKLSLEYDKSDLTTTELITLIDKINTITIISEIKEDKEELINKTSHWLNKDK